MYNETNNTHASGDNDRRRYHGYLQHEQCILDSCGRNNCNKVVPEYFPATACVGGRERMRQQQNDDRDARVLNVQLEFKSHLCTNQLVYRADSTKIGSVP